MASVEMKQTAVHEKRKIESMDDLTPEERARQMRFAEKLRALAGKIHLDIDLDELRGRRR
jgi:acyl carrier protein phosphodiesterase